MEVADTKEATVAKFIMQKRFQKPEWAVNDCNTFIVEFHDYAYGTKHFDMCSFDYDTALQAARWQKHFWAAPEFLQLIGYKQCMLADTGDVILQDLGPFWCAWLVYERFAYTISHEYGLMRASVNKLKDYTVWSTDA